MLHVQARSSGSTAAAAVPDITACQYITNVLAPMLQLLTGQPNIINSPLQQYLNPVLLAVAQAVDFTLMGQILRAVLAQRRDESIKTTVSAFTSTIFQLHNRFRSAPAVQDKQEGMRACAKAMAQFVEEDCASWKDFPGHLKRSVENLCR
jgi:conjugal transfer/entry exclusion protein